MLSALIRALSQLSDPAVRRVVWTSVLAAIAGFLSLALLVSVLLFNTQLTEVPWLDTTLDVLGGMAVLVVPYFLFPAVVVAVSGVFLDSVVVAVERRYYPTLPSSRHRPLWEDVLSAARFFVVVLVLNLLALPLYLFPVLNLVVFYGLNGYLLGREYFELVALRHLSPGAARLTRKSNGLKLFAAGVIIAFLSSIPLVNLLAPVVAAAFMVHVFHGLEAGLRPKERP
ncbi:MAG TPA: EI24 domain-containing protein [Azospirillaceae bacterium]|nr:EI24 domain-containing protein [Azospirillaceae bacterium]